MKEKSIFKRTIALAVPMMIQNGITNAVGLVDSLMVGSLGSESITAVTIACQLIFVFNLAIFGGISGPGIYGAQYYGQGNIENVRNVYRLKIWICVVCAIAGILVFINGGSTLVGLYLKGTTETVDKELALRYGVQYLNIMVCQIIPFIIIQIYASTLRETGESIKPMVAGIVSVVLDVVFNYILIFGKFGFPALGIRGAAIATVIARVAEMLVIIIWTHIQKNKHEFINGIYRTIKVPKELAGKIVKKGFPIFLNEFMWAGGMAALTQCYSLKSVDVVTGISISNSICNLLNVVFIALGGSVGIIIGQLLGAKKFDEAEKNSTKLMWFSGGICIVLTVILLLLSGAFPKLYNTTDEIRKIGTQFIIVTALFFPLQGFLNALYFTLRSGGKTLITFMFDSGFTWVVVVSTAFILCKFSALSIFVIYIIIQALDVIKVAIGYVLIKKKIWINNIVE